jgi:hypothetical protein
MPSDPLRSLPKTKAGFVEPMDCVPVSNCRKVRNGFEIKLDGYRAVAVRSALVRFDKLINFDPSARGLDRPAIHAC